MLKKYKILFFIVLTTQVVFGLDHYFTYSGTRPISLGGAFTAIANDVNAISWNSAGMSQINVITAGIDGRFLKGFESYEYDGDLEYFEDIEISHPIVGHLNSLGIIIPLNFLTDRFGVQRQPLSDFEFTLGYGFNKRFDHDFSAEIEQGESTTEIERDGGVNSNTIAFSFKPTALSEYKDIYYLGVSVNFISGLVDGTNKYYYEGNIIDSYSYSIEDDYSGFIFDLDVLMKPNDNITIGTRLIFPHTIIKETKIEYNDQVIPTEVEQEKSYPFGINFGISLTSSVGSIHSFEYKYTMMEKMETKIENSIAVNPYNNDEFSFHYGYENGTGRFGYLIEFRPMVGYGEDDEGEQEMYQAISVGTSIKVDQISIDLGFEYGIILPVLNDETDLTKTEMSINLNVGAVYYFEI